MKGLGCVMRTIEETMHQDQSDTFSFQNYYEVFGEYTAHNATTLICNPIFLVQFDLLRNYITNDD